MYFVRIMFTLLLFFSFGCDGNSNKQINDKPLDAVNNLLMVDEVSSVINFSYNILGNATVGEVTTINVIINGGSYKDEIILSYRIGVTDDLIFGENQLQSMTLNTLSNGLYPAQQVTVIPQREGRLFLVVSADITSNNEIITKSTAIPIDVGKSRNK